MGNRMTPNRLNRFQSQPIIDMISICSQIRRIMVQARTASLFFVVKYHLAVQCNLIEMMRWCCDTSVPMAGLARSLTTFVFDASQGNGAPEASPAVPKSSQSRTERKYLHVVAVSNRPRGTARGPQP